jgi:hypothetical protein
MTARHRELEGAMHQAQGTLDRHRQHLERLYRYHDECPDGDPRKAQVERDIDRKLAQVHAAEREANAAADALIAYEDDPALGPDATNPATESASGCVTTCGPDA